MRTRRAPAAAGGASHRRRTRRSARRPPRRRGRHPALEAAAADRAGIQRRGCSRPRCRPAHADRRRSVVAARDAGAAAAHASAPGQRAARRTASAARGVGRREHQLRRAADAEPAGRAADSAGRAAAPDVGRTGAMDAVARCRSARRAARARSYILALLGVVAVIVVVAVMPGRCARRKKTVSRPIEVVETARGGPSRRRRAAKPIRSRRPRRRRHRSRATAPAGKGKRGKGTKEQAGRPAARTGVAAPPAPAATPRRLSSDTRAALPRRSHVKISAGVSSRPPPTQGDITKVISNNRGEHQDLLPARARARQHPHARQDRGEAVDRDLGPGETRRPGRAGAVQVLLEPCIKEVVQRWVFPQASEEYGTEFPLVFQGNE